MAIPRALPPPLESTAHAGGEFSVSTFRSAMELQPVILSGGSGTRLWPLSREQYPKQLLALVGDETMLQATAGRLNGFAGRLPVAEVRA